MINSQSTNIEILKLAGLKRTVARLAILEILKKNKPLLVEEIVSLLNKKRFAFDQATVYRTLESFLKADLVKKIVTEQSVSARYELNTSDHHHFTCQNCGQIEEISGCNVDTLIKEIKENKHLLVAKHTLEFYGLCANCHS